VTAPQQEAALPVVLRALRDAISALIDPKHTYIDGVRHSGPSLYMQLWDATPAEQISGRRVTESTAPSWIDALNLRIEIDTRIEIEQPSFRGVPPTVGRLREISKRGWRPQDVRYITQFTHVLELWAKEIDKLLNPAPQWTLPAACPACGLSVVYKRDAAGDRVRQPALQIGPHGCFCANPHCDAHWAPEHFLFLSNLLGYPLPSGVLE